MEIRVDRESPVPLYLQISGSIKEFILSGKLADGHKLPPERRLARALGVNRSTILSAYRQLKAEGIIGAHVGRGTEVLPATLDGVPSELIQPLPWRQLAHEAAAREPDPLLRDILALTERRDVICLSVGLPAPELLPVKALNRIQERLLAERGAEVLLHSPTEGVTAFREAVCQHMTTRGIQSSVPEILITSGSQQGLDLTTRVFLSPGDAVVVEQPSYFGALEVFRGARVRLLGVPADAEGMRTDVLESLLTRHRPKMIYTLPTFQNPSGCVLSLERRRHLLDLAYRYQIPVLEDDPYSDLRYDGEAVPSLKAMDRHGHVIYLSSFSKILFPGLRLGFIAAPRQVVRQLALAKQAIDLHSNTFGQWVIERFISEGAITKHLAAVRREYARKRDAMLSALAESAPRDFTWNQPEGGFYVWCRYSEAISPARLLQKASRERVSFLPGSASFSAEPVGNHLRLNFSFAPPEQIREGVMRLMRAIRASEVKGPDPNDAIQGTPPIV
jgi:DNA-binding transcriptional MocR family regulator